MEKRYRNVTAVGLMVIAAGILFFWGMLFMLGDPPWRGGAQLVVALEDGGGLRRGDRVQLQGVEIGTVRRVQLEAPRQVTAEIRLTKGLTLPADTRATVRADVFGAHTVDLIPGQAFIRLESGDTIHGLAEKPLPDLMVELGGQARTILANTDSILSSRAIADMQATAAILPSGVEAMRASFAELHLVLQSLRRSAEELETAEAGAALSRTLAELEGSARAFTAAAHSMETSLSSLASVLAKIDDGTGTLGRLVNDSTLYDEMNGAFREMRELAADVRERPGRYINISVF